MMSGDFLFSILSRAGLKPSQLVFRRRVAKSGKKTGTGETASDQKEAAGFKDAENFTTIGGTGHKLIDEKV